MANSNLPYLIAIAILFRLTCLVWDNAWTGAVAFVVFFIVLAEILRTATRPIYLLRDGLIHYALLLPAQHPRRAKYNEDNDLHTSTTNKFVRKSEKILDSIPCLQLPHIEETNFGNEGAVVLLTGSTGFVGSIILYDLLFHRERLGIRKIILIVRPKKGFSAMQRLEKMIKDLHPMFYNLISEDGINNDILEVIEGSDLGDPNAGLCPSDFQRLTKESNVSHIIHCAAAVSFIQPLPKAAHSNITATLEVQKLALSCSRENKKNNDGIKNYTKRRLQFIHISTAFVQGDVYGNETKPLEEKLFDLQGYNPMEVYESMRSSNEAKQLYAKQAMKKMRFPNTYAFSKSIGEHLLLKGNQVDKDLVNTTIVRPGIVGPACESPWLGFAGRRPSTLTAGICLQFANPYNLWLSDHYDVAFIPVDVVSRLVINNAFRVDNDNSVTDENRDLKKKSIVHAVWDYRSPRHRTWTWLHLADYFGQFAFPLDYISRPIGYSTVLINQLIPGFLRTHERYAWLHFIFVQLPFRTFALCAKLMGVSSSDLAQLDFFMIVPVLFFPFVKSPYFFRSDLLIPETFNPDQYVMAMLVSSHRFLKEMMKKFSDGLGGCRKDDPTEFPVGGADLQNVIILDLWWAMTLMNNNPLSRMMAWFVKKLMCQVSSLVTIDLISVTDVLHDYKKKYGRNVSEQHLVFQLESKQQNGTVKNSVQFSYMDWMVLFLIHVTLPDMRIKIPFLVENSSTLTDDWLARVMLWLMNGQFAPSDKTDTKNENVSKLEVDSVCDGLPMLRCRKNKGQKFIPVPVEIKFEKYADEYEQFSCLWLVYALCGRIDYGRIHVQAYNS